VVGASYSPAFLATYFRAGGDSLGDAFAQTALGVWGYMCDPETIKVDPECSRFIEAKGRDMCSLLFAFLDACLAAFHCDDSFIARDLRVVELRTPIAGLENGTVRYTKAEGGEEGKEDVFVDKEESRGAAGTSTETSGSHAKGSYYIKVAA
jgi:SHS2 domain-containing protein